MEKHYPTAFKDLIVRGNWLRKMCLRHIMLVPALAGGLGSYAQSPGGVTPAAWYRADGTGQLYSDAGITPAADGSQLYQWSESQGNGYDLLQSSAVRRPVFSNTDNLANFNPTVTFDGSNDFMEFIAGTGVNVIDRANGTLYAAGYVNVQKHNGFVGFHATMDYPGLHEFTDNKVLFFTGGPGYQGTSTDAMAAKSYFTAGAGWENDGGSGAGYAGATVSLNGTRTSYSGTQLYNANLSTGARDLRIGGDSNYGAFSGQLNEILVFDDRLTPTEMDRVESYLAIKYGSTYAAGARDYKNASGSTVWDVTVNTGYNHNIAGIANDGALNQKQSWSTNSNREVLIATTGLANTNAGNATALTAGQYLVWGDNGLAKAPTVAISGIAGISHRFASVWKVQNTGAVGTVRVAWIKTLSNLSLMQSADNVFDASDAVTGMTANEITVNGVVYNYADVTLSNGQYFTFAAKVAAPGGVTEGLLMWHKADDGTTTAGQKNIWQDVSGNGRDVTQNNNTDYQPALVTNASYAADSKNYSFNFNPFYYFDGSNDFFYRTGDSYFPATASPGSVYGVMFNSATGGWRSPYCWGDDDPGLNRADDTYYFFRDNGAPVSQNAALNTKPAHIGSMIWRGSTNGVYLNIDGKITANNGANIGTINNSSSPANFAIGSEGYDLAGNGNEVHQGGISEVFAYSIDHQNSTGDEKARINSYLAIKYGITLSDSAGTGVASYLSSSSDTIWNAIANAGYNNNILGIANDVNSALDQKQSKSNKAGQQLILGTTGLNNTNELNTTGLSDGQFVILGDNGMAQSLSSAFIYASHPELNLRFGAAWKVQNTGSVGTVRIAWPEGIPSIHLIQSNDAVFDDTDDITDMTSNTITINGITYNYADVTLGNGSYFTFAGYVVGPGNVASAAWYRADAIGQQFTDAGTTVAGDSAQLYQWNEYKGTGYDLVQASAGDRPVFSNATTLANFNPTVTFNGSQWMRYTAGTGINVIDRANGTIYAAGYLRGMNNVGFAGFHSSMDYPGLHTYNVGGGDYKLLFFTGGPGYNGRSTNSFTRNEYFTIGSAWQNGDGSTAAYAGGTVSLNGTRKLYAGTSDFQNANLSTGARDFQIGQDDNHGPLNGQLNEVVVFENELTEDEMDRVETYMAIKYGTTYADGLRDYKNSSSTTVWNAADNVGYASNIAGIARDNQGALNQKQSWSTNTGQQVLIGTTGMANTNIANATALNDGQFLIWGDNGLAKSPAVDFATIDGLDYKRFAAIWKVQNTGVVNTVRVAWPKGLSYLKLVQSNDEAIDGTDVITEMENSQVINGVEYAYADVTLEDGQYFTFAAFLQAPGGVTNGLSHWYRADKNTQAMGDGADLTSWTDFTSGVTVAQVEDVALPKWKQGDTTYFNFNPGVSFTTASQSLANLNVQTVSGLNYDIFTLTKEGLSPGGNGRVFSSLVNNDDASGSINYWDGIGIMADNRLERMNNTYTNRYLATPGSITWAANTPSIMYNTFSDTTVAKGLNGAPNGTAGTHSPRGLFDGGHAFGSTQFPGNGSDNAGFTGNIGELIIYGNGSITAAERNKVDAYLAIKYGVTLHNSNNYVTSQDVVVWDAALNAGFYNNVAGVGNDFTSALHQKQSRSQRANTNGQLIMSIGDLAATNAANTGSLEDGQFLLWGDNNVAQAMTATAGTYTTFSYAGGTNNGRRMNRIWKVQNTDVDQPMQVLFPRSSVGTATLPEGDACGAYAILFADDSAMTTNLVAVPLGITGDSVNYIVSHAFPGGMSYFSFGKVTPLDNGNIYLPAVVENTVEYDNNCGVGEWIHYHQTGDVSEKMFGTSGFGAADLDSLALTITPEGTSYDDGTRMTSLMPRITYVADSNRAPLPTGKVKIYYSAEEMAATAVPGSISQGWFKYDGDADAVMADIYGDGVFETGKAVEITPDLTGVEDGVNFAEFHNISSFSSFVYLSSTEDMGVILPVRMLYFRAEKQQDKSLLSWATASEVNSSGFAVERSKDARNWTEIGFVASKANSGKELSYSFLDEQPMNGDNFYRLKQLDMDGSIEYSQVQLVRFDKVHQLHIVPNPTNSNFVVKGLRGNNTIAVTNVAGQELLKVRTETVGEQLVQIAHLSAGMYFVTITNDDGSSEIHKVVKD